MNATVNIEYFRKLLQQFLKTNTPDLSRDTKLMEERTNAAYKIYNSLVAKDKYAALELAKMKLLEGLELSVFYLVLDISCSYFNRIPSQEQRKFCKKILPQCIKVYDRFSFSDNPDEGTYYKMVQAMQDVMIKYCEENSE